MRILATLLLAGFAASAGTLYADEEKVPLNQVPKAVLKTVKARFSGAELLGAEKEVEGGKTVYEIGLKHRGQKIEATLTPEGKLIEIEKQIAAKEMPQAVQNALRAKYPNAAYKMIEEVIKVNGGEERLEYYEVLLVTSNNKKLEVSVTPEGQFKKEEDKSKEKDE